MFAVFNNDIVCGKASMEKQGLYYRILCKCEIQTDFPCKIELHSSDAVINLGTCVKVGDSYCIDTKIPCKYIRGDKPEFYIVSKKHAQSSSFIPIHEDMPFPHLRRLDKARICHQEGQIGVVFTD